MNLASFEKYIKTISKEELDEIFDETTAKATKAKSPARRLGYALALDMLVIESNMRKPCPECNLSEDELLKELLG